MSLKELRLFLAQASNTSWFVLTLLFFLAIAFLFKDVISFKIKESKKDQVVDTLNKSKIVNSVLTNLMKDFGASRAYIYRFHNGVNYYDGSHKIKSSMDYEVVENGVATVGLLFQDVPTSLFAEHMVKIINGEIMGVPTDSISELSARSLMKDLGVTHAAVAPYFDKRGNLVMVIGLDFMTDGDIFFLEDRFLNYVKNIGDLVEGYTSQGMQPIPPNITRSSVKKKNTQLNKPNTHEDIFYSRFLLDPKKEAFYSLFVHK